METHRFPGQRALHILVRTAHIGASSMVLGSVMLGVAPGGWVLAAGLTGLYLISDDVYKYGADWFRFLQSWAIALKLLALFIGALIPAALPACLWTALILAGLISHAPGAIRQYPLWGEPGPCAQRKTQHNDLRPLLPHGCEARR